MSSGRRSWAVALATMATGSVLALGGSTRSWAGDDDTYQSGQEMKQDDSTAGHEMKREKSTSGDTVTGTATQSGGEKELAPRSEKDQAPSSEGNQ